LRFFLSASCASSVDAARGDEEAAGFESPFARLEAAHFLVCFSDADAEPDEEEEDDADTEDAPAVAPERLPAGAEVVASFCRCEGPRQFHKLTSLITDKTHWATAEYSSLCV
jgi:hypothetical protein